MSASLGNRVTHDIRCQLYKHLQYLSLGFFDKRQVGGVISRVNQDTGQLQAFLVWASQDLANNLLLLVGIGVMLFKLNWQLALFVLIPAPVVALFAGNFWRRIRANMHRFFRRWGKLNAALNESLQGLRIVKAFAQEPREVHRFQTQSLEVALAGIKAERTASVLFASISLVIMLGSLLVWYIGGRNVLFGKMSLGDFWAFIAYVGMFYGPLQSLSFLFNFSSRSLTAAERVFEVLDTQPEVRDQASAGARKRLDGEVEFRNVVFGYERHRPALKGVSFTVQAGEMIGLVGQSGAGKSTTINLLCRFYDANEGEIRIDGVPIRDLSLEDLRSQIGLVPQDTFLFSGTIAENIAYAKPDATREEIIRAAKVANAHDFIRKKPDGYETHIGEGGKGLSGGEMQRLAIARAVLHNPRILILDEATSHVDVETEKQVQEAIARLVKGRTTFAIAHRLSTLKNADRLLVLKDGEIAEIGTHDELLAKEDGEFHRLVKTYQEISSVRAVAR
ncbi:MAG TPA: ABC transporter ATP-binding protein [Armatimonadota bacterium]|nr:ABC transporter ATP-binding protein [Armatimonadota bacterium]